MSKTIGRVCIECCTSTTTQVGKEKVEGAVAGAAALP
jgi:hypothetical protein